MLLPPLQPTPAATSTTRRTASGTNPHRRCIGTPNTKKKQTRETAAAAKGQSRPDGRFDGRYKALCTAVEEQVIVAVPDVAVVVFKVMVLGALKFESGRPKLHTGKSTEPDGSPVTAALRVTVPLNPFCPVTVMSCVADWPGDEMTIVAVLDVGERLIPDVPTVTKTAADVEVA